MAHCQHFEPMRKTLYLRLGNQKGGVQNHLPSVARCMLAEQPVSTAFDAPGQDLLVELMRKLIKVLPNVLAKEMLPLFLQKIDFSWCRGGESMVEFSREFAGILRVGCRPAIRIDFYPPFLLVMDEGEESVDLPVMAF